MRLVPIALYGATGYTGRLVVAELRRRGLDFVISGRSEQKLRELSEGAGGGAPYRPASVDDPASLRALLEDVSVVINCAGPFTLLGEPVVQAAIATGTHYVDSTGEQPFIEMVFDRYGAEAEAAGVGLAPAMGFDYVPGDCIARLVAEGREPLEELVVAYAVKGFGATRGTLHSALEMARRAPTEIYRAQFEFPAPIGRKQMVRYPSGELITVPRHTDTQKVTSLISAAVFAPHPALAPITPFLMPAASLALRTPLKRVLGKAIDRLPEGPSEDDRRASEWTIVAVAKGAGGTESRGIVRGKDPYGLTAVTLVHAAEQMAGEGYDRSGALAPSTGYDPAAFLNYLGDHDVSWELSREPVAA